MYFFARIITVFIAFVLIGSNAVLAASVPVSTPNASAVPATCDAEFWGVVKNRAWMEAQREMTQNANLVVRPDSVLSMTCFGEQMEHLAWYADRNFPGDPDEGEGNKFGGFFTDFFVVAPDVVNAAADPDRSSGYSLFGVLEILILDQLVSNVSVASAASDAAALAPHCSGKSYYIDDNFPDIMLGERAQTETQTPVWTQIQAAVNSDLNNANQFSGCQRMNQLWQRSKCYDFATESSLDIHHVGGRTDHDGFYTLSDYVGATDYRTRANQCASPSASGRTASPGFEAACMANIHGGNASIPDLAGSAPTWSTASIASSPDAGASGAGDVYDTLNGLISGNCAAPVRLGYVVKQDSGANHVDSVCPTPGCTFDPPNSVSGTGRCCRDLSSGSGCTP